MKSIILSIFLGLCSAPIFAQEFLTNKANLPKSDATLIVMVHGIWGGADTEKSGTWGDVGNKWYSKINEDTTFEDADILVYSYPTSRTENDPIAQLAKDFEKTLTENEALSYENIVFVGHSMGGLVIKKFLTENAAYHPKTKFTYFFGTPSGGAIAADLLNVINWNDQLEGLGGLKGVDGFILQLAKDWSDVQPKFPVLCGYESKKIGGRIKKNLFVKLVSFEIEVGFVLVPFPSATLGCDLSYPINGNHMQIVKPFDQNNSPFPHFLLETAYLKNIYIPDQPNKIPVIAIDALKYSKKDGEADNPWASNATDIKRILTKPFGDFPETDVTPMRALAENWDPYPVINADPDLIFLHWSAFEGVDDCYLNGKNITGLSCSRLVSNLRTLLKNTTAMIAIYSRTSNGCKNVKKFFGMDLAKRSFVARDLDRLVFMDLSVDARNNIVTSTNSIILFSNAAQILRQHREHANLAEIGTDVCKVK